VGGHVVKMDTLKQVFEALGLENVATFIASGNVYFQTAARALPALENKIERRLREALGYDVTTFIRPTAALPKIVAHQPFPAALGAGGATLSIGFLKEAPATAVRGRVTRLSTAADRLHFHQQELYWLRRGGVSESPFSGAILEKTLGMPLTLRNVNTVRRLAAKYPPA
jgi:uncharacterized protein (DUF1697 family)